MGALSHCLLYQTSFIEVAVYVPDGVEYPARPVDTGQSYVSTPSKKTVIFWLVLSMLMRTAEPAVLVPGVDSGCVPADLDSALAAVELVLGVTALEPVFGVAELELVGRPFDPGWAWAPAVPVL
jgi:hypothetical protein